MGSVSLVSIFDSLPTELKDKVEERILIYQNAFAENTNRARAADFKIYKAWCDRHGHRPVPATPEQLEQFIWEMATKPKIDRKTGEMVFIKVNGQQVMATDQNKKVATVARYLSSIKYFHEIGLDAVRDVTGDYSYGSNAINPVSTKRVTMAMKSVSLKFQSNAQRQAAPIGYSELDSILDCLGDSLRDCLYKALISVAFDTMMRCSELVRVELEHIKFDPDGSGTLHLAYSKTDQSGKGADRYLSEQSIELIKTWCRRANIQEGLLFRSVNSRGEVLSGMHKDRVARIFKRLSERSGAKNYAGISAHSTRVGAAQELLVHGSDLPEMMQAGGWKSPMMPARYSQRLKAKQGAMAKMSKQRGRSKSDS
jgi:integrase